MTSNYPVKILTDGYSECSSIWNTPQNYVVSFFRLYFVIEGGAVITINDIDYELEAGNAYFIPGSCPSKNHCPDTMKLHWLHCVPATFAIDTVLSKTAKTHQWRLTDLQRWKPAFTRLGQQPLAIQGGEWYALQSLIFYLLADLLTIYETEPEVPNRTYLKLKPAIDFMDRSYLNNPSLRQISAKVNLAPNYFHRKFKQLLNGQTPHAYMTKKRLNDARALLTGSDYTLQEIAEQVGYENAFYFSRAFKKIFNISPSAARKNSMP